VEISVNFLTEVTLRYNRADFVAPVNVGGNAGGIAGVPVFNPGLSGRSVPKFYEPRPFFAATRFVLEVIYALTLLSNRVLRSSYPSDRISEPDTLSVALLG